MKQRPLLREPVPAEFCKPHNHSVRDIAHVLGVHAEEVVVRDCRDAADVASMFQVDVDTYLRALECASCDYRWAHGCDTSAPCLSGWTKPSTAKHVGAVRRTELMDQKSSRKSFGVLGKIEKLSGVAVPAGWTGKVDDLAAYVGLPVEEVASLWREDLDDLRRISIKVNA